MPQHAAFLDLDTVDPGDLDRRALEAAVPRWTHLGAAEHAGGVRAPADADILVTNKVPIDAAALDRLPALRLVCIAATGTNNVDLEAARARGVTVCNVVGYATPAVVQHVFALVLALRTRLIDHRDAVRAGAWSRSAHFSLLDYPISELAGTTLGIVGYGELGHGVARVARAFGMEVLIARRPGTEDLRPGRVAFEELLERADVVSLHCPLTPATRGLMDAAALARMKPTALLVNTARGPIVDGAALLGALEAGRIGGAGLDVLDTEPPPAEHPLVQAALPNLIVTPHVAWASREARQRLVQELARNIEAFREGRPRNVVAAP